MCSFWKVFCFCAQYKFLMYRLENVLSLCTVQISDVSSGKCSVSVHNAHFRRTVWKVFCFLHNTHFWCTVWKVFWLRTQYTFLITVWKVFCLCVQYTFLMYRVESVLALCSVHISDVPSGKCSVLCTVHISGVPCGKCSVLCTVHISGVPCGKCSVSVHSTITDAQWLWYFLNNLLPCTYAKVFVLLALLLCDFTMEKTVPIPAETCNRSSIPYEFDRYEISVLHPHYIAVWRSQSC